MFNTAKHLMCTRFAGSLWGVSLAILWLLMTLPVSTAHGQAETCVQWRNTLHVEFPESDFISGVVNQYGDSACSSVLTSFNAGNDGIVNAPDQESAVENCDAGNGGYNYAFREMTASNPDIWWCDPSAPEPTPEPAAGSGSRKRSIKGSRKRSVTTSSTRAPKPVVYTGEILNMRTDLMLTAVNGLYNGIQFQRVSPAGVGIQFVLDLGYLDAVDVRGIIGDGYEVCFPQLGQIILLNAATAPRTVTTIDTYTRDGYTCGAMDRAGTMVLVQAPLIL